MIVSAWVRKMQESNLNAGISSVPYQDVEPLSRPSTGHLPYFDKLIA